MRQFPCGVVPDVNDHVYCHVPIQKGVLVGAGVGVCVDVPVTVAGMVGVLDGAIVGTNVALGGGVFDGVAVRLSHGLEGNGLTPMPETSKR